MATFNLFSAVKHWRRVGISVVEVVENEQSHFKLLHQRKYTLRSKEIRDVTMNFPKVSACRVTLCSDIVVGNDW